MESTSISTADTSTILVVGPGYSGLYAAQRLASQGAGDITLVAPDGVFVERIRLHQHIVGTYSAVHDLSPLLHPSIRLVSAELVDLDLDNKHAQLSDRSTEAFDLAILATGMRADAPDGTLDVGALRDAQFARERLAVLSEGARVAVIGGGLTGVETATEVAEARPDLGVDLIAPKLIPDLGERARRHVARTLERLGVVWHEGRVVEVNEAAVSMEDGHSLRTDLALWCGPMVRADPALTRAFGLTPGERVAVDGMHRPAGHSDIRVIGDAAIREVPSRMSCQGALPTGAHLAEAIVTGHRGQEYRGQEFSQRYVMRCVSLGRGDGVIQPSRRDDRAVGPALTGAAAAKIKESVCGMAFKAVTNAAAGRRYRWAK